MRIGSSYNLGLLAARRMRESSQMIARVLERLSSGKRVDSPKDDPGAFFTARILNARIRGLKKVDLGINQAQGMLLTAEAGLRSQLDIVQRMRELTARSSSDLLSSDERNRINDEVSSLLSELNRITEAIEFNGMNLLNGDNTSLQLALGPNSENIGELEWSASRPVDLFERVVGNGVFSTSQTRSHGVTFFGYNIETADFNGDGHLDLIHPGWSNSTISYYLGNGDGSFSTERTISGLYTNGVRTADLNGDGLVDIAGVHFTTGNLMVYFNNGNGGFHAPVTYSSVAGDSSMDFGDVDNDGDTDIVVGDYGAATVSLYLNNGSGAFSNGGTLSSAVGLVDSLITDIDQDGINDIIMAPAASVNAQVFYGTGNGSFTAASNILFGSGGSYQVDVFDLNGDGRLDLIQGSANEVRVAFSTGTRVFGSAVTLSSAQTVGDLRAVDLDRDGDTDLTWADVGANTTSVLLNQGNGTFSTRTTFSSLYGVVAGDFDEDGILDLATRSTSTSIEIRLQGSKQISGLDQFKPESSADAQVLLEVLDRATERLTANLAKIGSNLNVLEYTRFTAMQNLEALSEIREREEEVDVASETSELARLQIIQQAQAAVLVQANLQMQVVFQLLRDPMRRKT